MTYISSRIAFLLAILVGVAANAQPTSHKTVAQNSTVMSASPSLRNSENSNYELVPVLGATSSTFAGIEGRNGLKIESLTGYQAGMNLIVGQNALQFESGLLVADRGAKFTFDFLPGENQSTGKADLRLRYLEIPLMARYSFQPRSQTRFFVNGGAIAAALIDATTSYSSSTTGNETSSAKEAYNAADLRATVGFGVNFRMTRSLGLALQANFQQSVTKIQGGDSLNVYNSSMGVNAGLSFDL